MLSSWVPTLLVVAAITVILGLFRKMSPPKSRMEQHRYDESQAPEPLPSGIIGGAMWALAIGFLLLFFVLRAANHWWASFVDGPSLMTQYAPVAIWCFFPGFAALAIPWPLTVWYLRKVGRGEEADSIEDRSDSKSGMNSFRIMKWLSIGLVARIGIFTALAIPIHFSIKREGSPSSTVTS